MQARYDGEGGESASEIRICIACIWFDLHVFEIPYT